MVLASLPLGGFVMDVQERYEFLGIDFVSCYYAKFGYEFWKSLVEVFGSFI